VICIFFEMSDLDVTQIHVSESNLADLSSSSDEKNSIPPRKVTVSHLNRKFRDLQSRCEFQQADMLMWLKADKAEREAKEASEKHDRELKESVERHERLEREATEKQERLERSRGQDDDTAAMGEIGSFL
jgi:predicted RNase H-like nuclease (RuvC/YqgF family)